MEQYEHVCMCVRVAKSAFFGAHNQNTTITTGQKVYLLNIYKYTHFHSYERFVSAQLSAGNEL